MRGRPQKANLRISENNSDQDRPLRSFESAARTFDRVTSIFRPSFLVELGGKAKGLDVMAILLFMPLAVGLF